MIETILFFIHFGLLLLYGLILSASFAGVSVTKQNLKIILGLFLVSGLLQLGGFFLFGVAAVWKAYPLLAHLPAFLLLFFYYRKPFSTSLISIATAYLFCLPSKWLGFLAEILIGGSVASYVARILVFLAVGHFAVHYLSSFISRLYTKDNKSVYIFGFIPLIFYLFDYSMSVYAGFYEQNAQVVTEFLPFFLCLSHVLFCAVYYKEYEQKADMERKEQMIRVTTQQQEKEVEAVKRSTQELRLLRHDMRLLLGNLAVALEKEDLEQAKTMVAGYAAAVENTVVRRYCENDTVNYVLANFAARCENHSIQFQATVEIDGPVPEELLFSSVLSNALDNALNAQLELPEKERRIKVMLKNRDGRLLLSVKNPFRTAPVFVDGLPVSTRKGHGYGTQSIRYMTERMGGNCQFSIQKDLFVLRVIV